MNGFMNLSRGRLLAVLGLAALAAGLAVVYLSAPRASSSSTPEHSYAVLDKPRSAQDAIVGWRAAGDVVATESHVIYTDKFKSVAIAPSDGGVCLVTQYTAGGGGLNCTTGDVPSAASVSYAGSIGLVPDGVADVQFTLPDGREVEHKVADNVWFSPEGARTAAFALDGQEVRVDLMPRDLAPDGVTVSPDGSASGGRR